MSNIDIKIEWTARIVGKDAPMECAETITLSDLAEGPEAMRAALNDAGRMVAAKLREVMIDG